VILVCAATRSEAVACAAGLAGAAGFEVLRTGVGMERAAAALRERLARGPRPDLVVSSGFAGALGADVPLHAWVTARALHRIEAGSTVEVPLAPGLLRPLPDAIPCAVVSAAAVLAGGHAAPAPAAVDMESAALGATASAAGVPFAVLRLVTDTPAVPLAAAARAAGAALAARGIVARAMLGARVAAEVVASPAETARLVRRSRLWRDLLRDGWRARAATLAGV
jgi:nucleoside phosphorylase